MPTGDETRTRWLIGVGSAVAAVAAVLAIVTLTGDDDPDERAEVTTTTTTTEQEETTTSESTTTTEFAPTVDPTVPVWPRAHTSQRFDDPTAVVRSFAADFLGMTDPLVGELLAGDARSGEVELRSSADGPVTTVLVRLLEDDTWFVIGSTTENIVLDSPARGEDIDCPVQLTGEALAFEGHVDVAIYDDFSPEPIGVGFVTGGGGPSAPFDGTVDCDMSGLDDGVHHGAIVLTTASGEDGSVMQAVVVRVALQ